MTRSIKRGAPVLAVLILAAFTINTGVYAYVPLLNLLILEHRIQLEEYCVGFVVPTVRTTDLTIQPRSIVCTTNEGVNVYEGVSIRISTNQGVLLYRDVLRFYVRSSRALQLHFVVEYPAKGLNAVIFVYSGRSPIATIPLYEICTTIIMVKPGIHEYTLNLLINTSKPGLYLFRVGVHVATA